MMAGFTLHVGDQAKTTVIFKLIGLI